MYYVHFDSGISLVDLFCIFRFIIYLFLDICFYCLSGVADSFAVGDSMTELADDSDMPYGGVKSASVYLSIISQQTFIGCWNLNTELSQLLDISLDQLKNSAPVKVSYIYHLKNMRL